jgi:hypothetical protein
MAEDKAIYLSDLPPQITSAKGNMLKVFKMIYTSLSEPIENSNTNANSDRYVVKSQPRRSCCFVMADGRKLKFFITMNYLIANPGREIILTLTQSPDSLYLESIEKSAELKGVEATNYAYELAAALGAKWLFIWDAASIKCGNSEEHNARSYPLSLYRALTVSTPTHPSWYENVAIKHGYMPNNTLSETYNYADSIAKLRSVTVAELLEYYKAVKQYIESDEATQYTNIQHISGDGGISGNKQEFDDTEKTNIIKHISKIIDILLTAEHDKLVDLLKSPSKSCFDKAYILRSFPGNNTMDMEIPNIYFNEGDEKLIEFPYLVESLIVASSSDHLSIKLYGGRKKRGLHKSRRALRGYKRKTLSKSLQQ